jgi:hypothetical protein
MKVVIKAGEMPKVGDIKACKATTGERVSIYRVTADTLQIQARRGKEQPIVGTCHYPAKSMYGDQRDLCQAEIYIEHGVPHCILRPLPR